MPAGCENDGHDFRWILLLVLSFCISLWACKGNDELKLTARNTSCTVARTWHENRLSWDSAGPLGPGVYGDKSKPQGTGDVANSPASPRIAVFVFQPYDLNQVDVDTLQIVKGIGPKLAHAIVNYRMAHGPFHSIDDLLAVKGIGRAKLASLRNYLTLPIVKP